MTKPYFLPPRLAVIVSLKRSRCKSSSGLVVKTTFLLWNELLVYLLLRQNSQEESFSKLIFGNLLLAHSEISQKSASYEHDQTSYAIATFCPQRKLSILQFDLAGHLDIIQKYY